MEKQRLDDAWRKMQDRLEKDPPSANWTAFSEKLRQGAGPASEEERPSADQASQPASPRLSAPPAAVPHTPRRTWPEWLHRQRRWLAGAAAAAAFALTLGTPAGNEALASLLSQFRMEQLTVVEEQDLRNLFQSIGVTDSTMNQYGEFSHASSGEYTTYGSIEALKEAAGQDIVVPAWFQGDEQHLSIGVTPSRTITMKVKVNEINDTMRKLGADTLLPASIDGKRITLTLGSAIHLDQYRPSTEGYSSLTQRPVPTLAVEEGVPLAEALEAVLRFPLIPAELKQELRQSQVLDSGSAPLPIVMPSGYEPVRIGNTEVLLIDRGAAEGHYGAAWAKNGRLFTFTGTFPDRDAFTAALTELVGS